MNEDWAVQKVIHFYFRFLLAGGLEFKLDMKEHEIEVQCPQGENCGHLED